MSFLMGFSFKAKNGDFILSLISAGSARLASFKVFGSAGVSPARAPAEACRQDGGRGRPHYHQKPKTLS
jgi:hypothetical protein